MRAAGAAIGWAAMQAPGRRPHRQAHNLVSVLKEVRRRCGRQQGSLCLVCCSDCRVSGARSRCSSRAGAGGRDRRAALAFSAQHQLRCEAFCCLLRFVAFHSPPGVIAKLHYSIRYYGVLYSVRSTEFRPTSSQRRFALSLSLCAQPFPPPLQAPARLSRRCAKKKAVF